MDELFATIAASALPGDVKTDITNYVSAEADGDRREEVLKLLGEFAALNGDEARAFEQVTRGALAEARGREDVVERKAAISAHELADKAKKLAAIESIKKTLKNLP